MNEGILIQTTQHVPLQMDLATLGDRILAYLIDGLIVGMYAFIAIMVWGFVFGSNIDSVGGTGAVAMVVAGVLLLIPAIAYHLLMEIFNNGQSIGKRAMDIQVVAKDGGEVTVGMYLLRWLLRFVDISLFNGIVAIITIAVSDNRQRLGDMVANTVVIKLKKKSTMAQTPYSKPEDQHEVRYSNAILLEREDVMLIKETLNSRDVVGIDEQVRILAQKVADKLNIPVPENPRLFLRDVIKDYSHLRS